MHILIYKNVPKNRDFIFGLNRSGQRSLNLDPCIYMSFFVLYSQYPPSKCTRKYRKEFAIWQIGKSRARFFYDLATFSHIKISGNLENLHYLQKKFLLNLDRVKC